MDIFQKAKTRLNLQSKTIYMIVLLVILAGGAFLRLYRLGDQRLWIDEGFSISQAQGIVSHGIPLLDSGKTDFKDALYSYLLAGEIKSGGLNISFFRVISILFGLISIIIGYFIFCRLTNRAMGLIYSFFLSFSYWNIAWSRQIRPYVLFILIILAVVYFLTRYHREKAVKFLILAFLFIGLATLTKTIGALMFISLVLFLAVRKNIKLALSLFLFIAVAGALLFPLIEKKYSISLNASYMYYLDGYFWKYYTIYFVLSIFGIFFAFKSDTINRPVHIFLLSFWLIGFVLLSTFTYVTQFRYAFPFSIILFFYANYFIYYFGHYFWKKRIMAFGFVALLFAANFFLVSVRPVLTLSPCEGSCPLEDYTPQPDFATAYEYLRQNMQNNDTLISAYPFMDKIFMGKTGYGLVISYTGRQQDLSVTEDRKEYYSGSEEIYSAARIMEMTKNGNVFALLDRMALARSDPKIRNFIHYNGRVVFNKADSNGEEIFVYKLSQNTEFFDRKQNDSNDQETNTDNKPIKQPSATEDNSKLGPAINGEDIIFEDPGNGSGGIDVEIKDQDFTDEK